MSDRIQVGFGRVDIMPQGPIELGGLGNGPFRISNNILDTLYATCIAITDSQEQTLLLITMDLLHAMQGMVADMRKIITEQTGIPGEHIIIAATHTHAGPDIFNPGPKTEDIINRAGGILCVELCAAGEDGKPDPAKPVIVYRDGVRCEMAAGGTVEITTGNSITLTPYLYHRFYTKKGSGDLVVGEVSKINDDNKDNVFARPQERFCAIREDEPVYRLLVNEY